MSGGYMVVIETEDTGVAEIALTTHHGPFRFKHTAISFAARIGREAGLNLNNFGGWSGTDGDKAFAFIRVVEILPTDNAAAWAAVKFIRDLFNHEAT